MFKNKWMLFIYIAIILIFLPQLIFTFVNRPKKIEGSVFSDENLHFSLSLPDENWHFSNYRKAKDGVQIEMTLKDRKDDFPVIVVGVVKPKKPLSDSEVEKFFVEVPKQKTYKEGGKMVKGIDDTLFKDIPAKEAEYDLTLKKGDKHFRLKLILIQRDEGEKKIYYIISFAANFDEYDDHYKDFEKFVESWKFI